MALVFVLSSRARWGPLSDMPDWSTHAAGYAVLAVLACRALAGGLRRSVTVRVAAGAVLISALYGVTDEVHQSFVPGRTADAWDLMKDVAGAAVGALACAWPRPESEQRSRGA